MDLNSSLPADLVGAAERMRGFPAPWCIAGGSALDLFLGRVTREHGDVDLAVFREDQGHLHRWFAGWRFQKVVNGELVEWPAGEWLSLPVHEVHARQSQPGASGLEILLNERSGESWTFRRDPTVRCPVHALIEVPLPGFPVLCPAVVLLYKAKNPRPADELDFRAVVGHLAPERRAWLRSALAHAHPGHPWSALL